MRHACVAMAAQANNLIVDDVLLGPEKAEYVALLSTFDVYFVGVFASLDVLEAENVSAGSVDWAGAMAIPARPRGHDL